MEYIKDNTKNITVKRRIFIANTGMVLFSLLILLAVGSGIVDIFKNEFLSLIGQKSALSENIYEVQTILYNIDDYGENWEKLSSELSKYNYELYVSDEDFNKVYSNSRHRQLECIEELEKIEFNSDKIVLYSMEGVTIAKEKVIVNGNYNYIYASYYSKDNSVLGMDKGMFEMFIIVFIIVGILTVALLLFVSQLITKKLTQNILEPVDRLTEAAKRIEEGNFDEIINYDKNDEFLNVCTTFDNMQIHLKESIEQSAAYEKSRTEMVSGISHDLRTPLTSVKAFIKGIIDGVANTPEKQEKYLEISYRKACDMEKLLQKLFFFSKLETGNMPFYKQKIEINNWLEKYKDEKLHELQEKNVSLEFVSDKYDHYVNIDVEQIRRVVDNIIENSIKYADVNCLNIKISLTKVDEYECISIYDNGKGVDNEKLPHLFEQFYRGDESRNSKNDGSGLGLYVCKYIIEKHGGIIEAKSDNGFVMEIKLPCNINE